MPSRMPKTIALVLSFAVCAGATSAAGHDARGHNAIQELLRQVDELRSKLDDASGEDAAEIARLRRVVETLDKKLAELEARTQAEPEAPSDPRGASGQHQDVTGSFIEEGSFDKSIEIPGTSLAFRFGGYAKLDFIQDFDAIGNRSEFQTSSIPVAGSPGSNVGGATTIQAKETRLNIDVRSPTPAGNFRVFVEGDFYGDGNAFHLRHSYGVLGHLLGGQTWTTFMDIDAVPDTIDFEVPDSSIFVRQALIRWEQSIAKKLRWGVAVEDPHPEISNPAGLDGVAQSTMPDIVTRIKYTRAPSRFVSIAGIVRQIRFNADAGTSNPSATGWGVNVTGRWRTVGSDALTWQVALGDGISRYIEAYEGFGYDAVLSADGDLQLIPAKSFVLGYRHYWRSDLRSTVSFALARLDNQPAQPTDAIHQVRSPHLNLIWSPWHLVEIGGEVMWGERIDKNDGEGTATRFQLGVKFMFN